MDDKFITNNLVKQNLGVEHGTYVEWFSRENKTMSYLFSHSDNQEQMDETISDSSQCLKCIITN
jgi:hypothetical protein